MTTQRERRAANKRAFDEVIGDPYSMEDLPGQYSILRNKDVIKAVDNSNIDMMTHTEVNPAVPNPIDFICDVESAIEDGCRKYATAHSLPAQYVMSDFYDSYIWQNYKALDQKQRAEIEQVIGQILIARKISPVVRYFTAIKHKRL